MRYPTTLAAIMLVATGPMAFAEAAPPISAGSDTADRAAIAAAFDSLRAAWGKKDPNAILSHFAPDANALESGAPPMHGQAMMRPYVEGVAKDPGFTMSMIRDKIDRSGDLGYVQGRFRITYTDDKTSKVAVSTGSFIAILKRQADGAWKVVEDISAVTT